MIALVTFLRFVIIFRFDLHSDFCDFADGTDFDAQSSNHHLFSRLDSLPARKIIHMKNIITVLKSRKILEVETNYRR